MAVSMTFPSDSQQSDGQEPFRILVIGNPDVGKRTLIASLLKSWTQLGVQESNKTAGDLDTEGRDLILQILETSAKKRFQFFQHLPSCDAFLLVYSLVDDASFQSVSDARDRILQEEKLHVPIVFAANKTDIADSVDKNERVYRDLNISCEWEHGHVEVSAEKDEGVSEVLRQILKRYNKHVADNVTVCESPRSSLKENFKSLKKLFSRKK